MRNAGPDELQAGIKIGRRNIDKLRYADDATLMADSEELKSLLMRVEESKRTGLRLNIEKTKSIATGPITAWQIEEEMVEIVADFLFLGSKITVDSDYHHEIRRRLLLDRQSIVAGTFKKLAQIWASDCLPALVFSHNWSCWSLISPCSCGCSG